MHGGLDSDGTLSCRDAPGILCYTSPDHITEIRPTVTCATEAALETRLVLVAIVQMDLHVRAQKSAEHNVRFWLYSSSALWARSGDYPTNLRS
jgi:hypothetical protein